MASYQVITFDGVSLPLYNPEQDAGADAESGLIDTVGRTFDYVGSRQRLPRRQAVHVRGVFYGFMTFWETESGDRIVTETGDELIFGNGTQMLRAQLDALTAKIGAQGQLVRKRWDDQSVTQWITARLLRARPRSRVEDHTVATEVDALFESSMAAWRSSTATSTNGTLVSGGSVGMLVESGGNAQVDDAVITVTASGAITSLRFQAAAEDVDFSWSGSLASGQSLVIDCGARTVQIGSTDAYNLALNAAHTALGWLVLPAGLISLVVTSDGPGSVQIDHYDQWV